MLCDEYLITENLRTGFDSIDELIYAQRELWDLDNISLVSLRFISENDNCFLILDEKRKGFIGLILENHDNNQLINWLIGEEQYNKDYKPKPKNEKFDWLPKHIYILNDYSSIRDDVYNAFLGKPEWLTRKQFVDFLTGRKKMFIFK